MLYVVIATVSIFLSRTPLDRYGFDYITKYFALFLLCHSKVNLNLSNPILFLSMIDNGILAIMAIFGAFCRGNWSYCWRSGRQRYNRWHCWNF